MINWNDIKVEQEIAQERYRPIIQGREVARALEKEQPRVNLYDQFRNWLTSIAAQIGIFRKQPVCCVE